MSLRTPLKNARHLGSAKEGVSHFWKQRLTAVANLVLSAFLVYFIVAHVSADHATVKAALAQPLAAVAFILLFVSAAVHMRLGMQTIIEDYVHGEGSKVAALMLNIFFAVVVAAASILSILKIHFGV